MSRLSMVLTTTLALTAAWATFDAKNADACSPPRPGNVTFIGVQDGDVLSDEPGIIARLSGGGAAQYKGFQMAYNKALVPITVTSLGVPNFGFGEYVVIRPKMPLATVRGSYTLTYNYVSNGTRPPIGSGGSVSFRSDSTLTAPAQSTLNGRWTGNEYAVPGPQNSCQSSPPIEKVSVQVTSATVVEDIDLLRLQVFDANDNPVGQSFRAGFQTVRPPNIVNVAELGLEVLSSPKVKGVKAECVEIQGFQTSHGLETSVQRFCKPQTSPLNCPANAGPNDKCYQVTFTSLFNGGGMTGTNTGTSTSTSTSGTNTSSTSTGNTSTGNTSTNSTSTSETSTTSTSTSQNTSTSNNTSTGTSGGGTETTVATSTSGNTSTGTNTGTGSGTGTSTSGGGDGGGNTGAEDDGCNMASHGSKSPSPVGWLLMIAGSLLALRNRRRRK